MKVTVGNVTKNIPQEYAPAIGMISEEQHDAPEKIRLSPWERFLYAEAAWRSKQTSTTKMYLSDVEPACVISQWNRLSECRYVVEYKAGLDDDHAKHAIVPVSVYRACPVESRMMACENFTS